MTRTVKSFAAAAGFACVLMAGSAVAQSAAPPAPASAASPQRTSILHATGTFTVKTVTAEASDLGKGAGLGRMTLDKVFSGGIEGASKGEMLTAITGQTTAMAYVALERVTGAVGGKTGSFLLSHSASMLPSDPASAQMTVTVVPYSGTGDLSGIDGRMTIDIKGGVHSYDFIYTLLQQ